MAVLVLAGCDLSTGGSAPTTQASSASTSPPATAASQPPSSGTGTSDACALITQQEATTAIGVTATPQDGNGPNICGYFGPGQMQSVSILLVPGKASVLEPQRARLQGRAGYQDVSGVGDLAFLGAHGGGGQLYFSKGSTLATITLSLGSASLDDAALTERLITIARNAAGRL